MKKKGFAVYQKRRGKFGNNMWFAYSKKLDKQVTLESDIEHANFLSMELDPEIVLYELHPGPIYITMGDTSRRTEFDAKILYKDNTVEYVEVKYEQDLQNDDRTQQQIEFETQYCKDKGYNFRIVTDLDFMGPDNKWMYDNMLYMYHLSSLYDETIVAEQSKYITDYLARVNGKKAPIHEIIAQTTMNPSVVFDCITYLLIHGIIKANIRNDMISYKMEVALAI